MTPSLNDEEHNNIVNSNESTMDSNQDSTSYTTSSLLTNNLKRKNIDQDDEEVVEAKNNKSIGNRKSEWNTRSKTRQCKSESNRKTNDKSPPKTRSQAAREASSKLSYLSDSTPQLHEQQPTTSKKAAKIEFIETYSESLALVSTLSDDKLTPQIYINDQTTKNWLNTFKIWDNKSKLSALEQILELCDHTHIKHVHNYIEPKLQRDYISELPKELILLLLTYVRPKDLYKLAQVSHYWHQIANDPILWKNICKRYKIDISHINTNTNMNESSHNPLYPVNSSCATKSTSNSLLINKNCRLINKSNCLVNDPINQLASNDQSQSKLVSDSNYNDNDYLDPNDLESYDDNERIDEDNPEESEPTTSSAANSKESVSANTNAGSNSSSSNNSNGYCSPSSPSSHSSEPSTGSSKLADLESNTDKSDSKQTNLTKSVTSTTSSSSSVSMTLNQKDTTKRRKPPHLAKYSNIKSIISKTIYSVCNSDNNNILTNSIPPEPWHSLSKYVKSPLNTILESYNPFKRAYLIDYNVTKNWCNRPLPKPFILRSHDDHVITCLKFDGYRVVSGSDDCTLKVWCALTSKLLQTLVGHTGGVWASQLKDNIVISGSTDRTVRVWNIDTGECIHVLTGHTSTVRCLALNGNIVVSGSRDSLLRVWNIETGQCMQILRGHVAAVRCVCFDGKHVVSGSYDFTIRVWNPFKNECLHVLEGHSNRVYSLLFDGNRIVSGSLDTTIIVWDVHTGSIIHKLTGHQSLTSGMQIRGDILVSGNADSTVKIWSLKTGECLHTLSGTNKHMSAVTCLAFNEKFVVSSSDDGTVKLWNLQTGEFIRNLLGLDSGGRGGVVWRISMHKNKLVCAVGSRIGVEETKLILLDFDWPPLDLSDKNIQPAIAAPNKINTNNTNLPVNSNNNTNVNNNPTDINGST